MFRPESQENSWSEKADNYIEGLEKTRKEIEEYEKREKELDSSLKGKSLEERKNISKELTEVRTKLREARFNQEMLKLKKAA